MDPRIDPEPGDFDDDGEFQNQGEPVEDDEMDVMGEMAEIDDIDDQELQTAEISDTINPITNNDTTRHQRNGSNGHKPGSSVTNPRSQEYLKRYKTNRQPNLEVYARPNDIHPPASDKDELIEALVERVQKTLDYHEAVYLTTSMVPLVAQKISSYHTTIVGLLPVLLRGVANATKVMMSQSASRQYLKLMPEILEKTFNKIVQFIEQNQTINPQAAADILAKCTGTSIEEYYRSHNHRK